ncbi:hypothetical protein HNR06_003586 [Nocardiopsis arvandica]|uniref:Uncharacterized protein n=1 Tax=Nocardiopsis sinuspersici TaxID=501010 RepID=A0A7Y9XFZ0_9ACTN|nr:hypothetical protein [Nocardiopsis sinuspersici]NYH53997.1 hypothetical protein [Nocardiopsis sinuspersici]
MRCRALPHGPGHGPARPRRERRHTVTPVTPTRLVAAATVVAVVPCVLYPLVGLWTLLWIPAVLLLGSLLQRFDGAFTRNDDTWDDPTSSPASEPSGTAPEAPGAARGTRVRPTALPSAVEDYDLVFSAVVHWRWDGHVDLRLRNPVAPAVLAVVTRASELARGVTPSEHGVAECELAARLAVETAVTGAGIVVWAEEVGLRLPEEDAERLHRVAGLRKDRELREAVRDAEEESEELEGFTVGPAGPVLPPRPAPDGELDPLGDPLGEPPGYGEDEPAVPPGPGSDVDVEGYESYWWPAEGGGHESAERDVQVAILRSLIDSLPSGPARTEFARDQLELLERGGFSEVARRIREEYAELDGDDALPGAGGAQAPESGS